MATFRKGNYVADLGAMVVTGLGKKYQIHFSPGSGTVDHGKESYVHSDFLQQFEIESVHLFQVETLWL